ncbi:hypothetical protein WMF28_12020 [Sorangium sp. So ce590]|uniref:hypothetical protein n=1 Tax=Sorangium sp. So ce590 TaxID=3133317 RepID=UPI003F617429
MRLRSSARRLLSSARLLLTRCSLNRIALPGALLAALSVAGAAVLAGGQDPAPAISRIGRLLVPPARAAPAPRSAAASVALLATSPGGARTTLHIAAVGGAQVGPALATIRHLSDAVVRARVVPRTPIVVATADTSPARDRSFNASLFRIAPHAEPVALCDRVVHASRPLVTADGRVFVSRGVAGPEPPRDGDLARLRVDALTIDEVDLVTGATRTAHRHTGYLAFLAGEWNGELVVYRVSPGSADIVLVDPDSGTTRVIAPSIPPFARDFSIDAATGALVFQERHETNPGMWVIDRIDLARGKRTRLEVSASNGLAPHVWPGGGLAYTPTRATGLFLVGARARVRGPLGAGVDAIQAVSSDAAWVAALHTNPSTFAVPFAIHVESGEVAAIPAPSGARIAVAGFTTAKEEP